MRFLLALLVVAAALVMSGCGIADPLNVPADRPTLTTTVSLDTERGSPNEVPSPHVDLAAMPPAADAAATPRQAIANFDALYVNWTYRTLAAQQRRLARSSVGAASNAQQRAAAQTPLDYELRRGRVENRGSVVAIAPARVAGRYIVVSYERTTTARTPSNVGSSYHVTVATVQRLRMGGWAVSSWQPQS